MAVLDPSRFGVGDYISDGRRLLRIIDWPAGEDAIVEDCATNTAKPEALNRRHWLRIDPEHTEADDG